MIKIGMALLSNGNINEAEYSCAFIWLWWLAIGNFVALQAPVGLKKHHPSLGSISRDRLQDPIPDDKFAVRFKMTNMDISGRQCLTGSVSIINLNSTILCRSPISHNKCCYGVFLSSKTTSTLMGPEIVYPGHQLTSKQDIGWVN